MQLRNAKSCKNQNGAQKKTSQIIQHENNVEQKNEKSNEIRFVPFEATWGPERNSPHEYCIICTLVLANPFDAIE